MFELRPYNNRHGRMTYNPFKMMDDFEKDFFAPPFGDFFKNNALAEFRTDIKDNGDSYLLEADLPGFDKKDINLEVNGDTLEIVAERHTNNEKRDENDRYICCERSYGRYSRRFNISSVESEKITASYENGVLKLEMPKKAEIKPKSHRLEIR